MTSNNYITILGWMTNLGIKGNEIIVYAIIHGFSQDGDSYFHGSIKYLAKWTGLTDRCIIDILKNLVDKGLLEKVEREGTTNLYKTINPFERCDDAEQSKKKICSVDDSVYEDVIGYLNKKTSSRYRINNDATRKLIKNKLNAGFTIEDFHTVIDNKCDDWLDNPDFSQYLRPATLFGNKFESYLNQNSSKKKREYSLENDINNDVGLSVSTTKIY